MLRKIIRLRFTLTPSGRAIKQVRSEMEKTLAEVTKVGLVAAAKPCQVPPMLGVDREMRRWSLLQILAHNTIVNNQMCKVLTALGEGREIHSNFNAKTDTLPPENPGPEETEFFRESVDQFLIAVQSISDLRGTKKHRHPVMGMLSAHGWLCMFGLHLSLHRKQAQKVSLLLKL